jgi:hypothetical protein
MSYDPREKVCPPLQPLDRYAAEKGLAKRVAHGLRGILAKLPDQPPCHDWPSREDLPTTDPED